MQILNIIFTIVAIIANAAMTYFAVTAWFELRRTKRDIADMKRAIAVTTSITMGQHVKANYEELNDMKAAFHRLVKDERYEEAEELKKSIMRMERHADEALDQFKHLCGDYCKVIVTKVKSHIDEEK